MRRMFVKPYRPLSRFMQIFCNVLTNHFFVALFGCGKLKVGIFNEPDHTRVAFSTSNKFYSLCVEERLHAFTVKNLGRSWWQFALLLLRSWWQFALLLLMNWRIGTTFFVGVGATINGQNLWLLCWNDSAWNERSTNIVEIKSASAAEI